MSLSKNVLINKHANIFDSRLARKQSQLFQSQERPKQKLLCVTAKGSTTYARGRRVRDEAVP